MATGRAASAYRAERGGNRGAGRVIDDEKRSAEMPTETYFQVATSVDERRPDKKVGVTEFEHNNVSSWPSPLSHSSSATVGWSITAGVSVGFDAVNVSLGG